MLDSAFASERGPAVVWSPAVPGRLQACSTDGVAARSELYHSMCDGVPIAGADVPPPLRNFDAAAVADFPGLQAGFKGPSGLLQSVVAAGSGMDDVSAAVLAGTALRAHLHLPPEALATSVSVSRVRSTSRSALDPTALASGFLHAGL